MNAKSRKPMFQRRHYDVIARAIARAGVGYKVVDSQRADIIKSLADILAFDNPNFDRSRFNAVASGSEWHAKRTGNGGRGSPWSAKRPSLPLEV